MSDPQEISFTEVDGVTVVRFNRAVIRDDLQIKNFGEELLNLVKDGRTSLLLNFEGVEILSSAALGKLIKLKKTIVDVDGKLKLACIDPDLYQVFAITNLNSEFEILADESAALAAF